LRAQLITLFRENGVPVIVFEHDENWKSFVAFLLWHVAGQPIAFPPAAKGRAKVIREEMLALPRPHNVAIERFTIVNHENVPHWQLEISGDKTFTMIGAVDIDKV
jgi:hypothetical protein